MLIKSPKLSLSDDEKKSLRKHKLTIKDIIKVDQVSLSTILESSLERAREIIALCEYQMIPSVGPRSAKDLVDLGYFSLEELKGKDGASLLNDLEVLYGCWMDPCVEDVMRLIAHYAEHRNDEKRWWDFTDERKQFRKKHGYPSTRPTKAWNDN